MQIKSSDVAVVINYYKKYNNMTKTCTQDQLDTIKLYADKLALPPDSRFVNIKTLSEASFLIDQMKLMHGSRPASVPQMNYARSLCRRHGRPVPEQMLSSDAASAIIDECNGTPRPVFARYTADDFEYSVRSRLPYVEALEAMAMAPPAPASPPVASRPRPAAEDAPQPQRRRIS